MRRALLLCALLLAAPSVVHAHGRPPLVGDLRFHPTDPDTVVARATWGLVLSRDGGERWEWICAAVTGADPTREDPAILVVSDGSILVGTFDGLSKSSPDRCGWTRPEPALDDVFVISLDARPAEPDTVYAIETSGTAPDRLHRSEDGGETFEPVGAPVEGILLERVRVAPSDPTRIYLSGADPSGASGDREAYVLRSEDAGARFERTRVALEDGERNVHLLAVDPSDADRLLVRVTRRITDEREERLLLSEDGGRSFEAVWRAREITDAAFAPDGATAWASANRGGLARSDDGGRSFDAVAPGHTTCVEAREGEIWTCADALIDGYALGRSRDGGDAIEEMLYFQEIHRLPSCGACTSVGYVCPEWFPDLAYDLRLDAGTGIPEGGVTGTPRDAAPPPECVEGGVPAMDGGVGMDAGPGGGEGCGCRAAGGAPSDGSPGLPAALLGVLAVGIRGRRRRRARG